MAEVLQLRQQLRRERLLVAEEKRHIEKLSAEIGALADKAFQASWRARQQFRSVDLLGSSQMSASHCAARVAQVEGAQFVSTFDPLTSGSGSCGGSAGLHTHDSVSSLSTPPRRSQPVAGLEQLGELFLLLRQHPEVSARLLVFASNSKLEVRSLAEAVISGVFGNALVPSDERAALQMLSRVLALQLRGREEARSLLRGVSGAFTVAFDAFVECSYPLHVYLADTLGDVIRTLVADDDRYFEFEASKLAARFADAKREILFTADMLPKTEKVQRFLDAAANKAVSYCQKIVAALSKRLGDMPTGLRWLLASVHQCIKENSGATEARMVVADLFFFRLVFPAIVSPESYVLRDGVPISEHARYNLTQIARVVQSVSTAAISGSVPPALATVHERIDLEPTQAFLNLLCSNDRAASATPAVETNDVLTRSAVLMTEGQLQCLLTALQKAQLPLTMAGVPQRVISLIGELHETSPLLKTPSRSPALERADMSRNNSLPLKADPKWKIDNKSAKKMRGNGTLDNKIRPSTSSLSLAPEDAVDSGHDVLIIPIHGAKPCGHVRLQSMKEVLHRFKQQSTALLTPHSFRCASAVRTSGEPSSRACASVASSDPSPDTGRSTRYSLPAGASLPASVLKMKTRARTRSRGSTTSSIDEALIAAAAHGSAPCAESRVAAATSDPTVNKVDDGDELVVAAMLPSSLPSSDKSSVHPSPLACSTPSAANQSPTAGKSSQNESLFSMLTSAKPKGSSSPKPAAAAALPISSSSVVSSGRSRSATAPDTAPTSPGLSWMSRSATTAAPAADPSSNASGGNNSVSLLLCDEPATGEADGRESDGIANGGTVAGLDYVIVKAPPGTLSLEMTMHAATETDGNGDADLRPIDSPEDSNHDDTPVPILDPPSNSFLADVSSETIAGLESVRAADDGECEPLVAGDTTSVVVSDGVSATASTTSAAFADTGSLGDGDGTGTPKKPVDLASVGDGAVGGTSDVRGSRSGTGNGGAVDGDFPSSGDSSKKSSRSSTKVTVASNSSSSLDLDRPGREVGHTPSCDQAPEPLPEIRGGGSPVDRVNVSSFSAPSSKKNSIVVVDRAMSIDGSGDGTSSPTATTPSSTGLRKISSAITMKVRRKRASKESDVSAATSVASSESAGNANGPGSPLDRRSSVVSPPTLGGGSGDNAGSQAEAGGSAESSVGRSSFWRTSRLSNFVVNRRRAHSPTVPAQNEQAPSGETSPGSETSPFPTATTPTTDSQADTSVLDDITAKYKRLAEEEKSKKVERDAETPDGVSENACRSLSKKAEDEAIFFQAKRQLEAMLAEPSICGIELYSTDMAQLCREHQLPPDAGNVATVQLLLRQEQESAKFWDDDNKRIETLDTINLVDRLSPHKVDCILAEISAECRQRSYYMAYLLQVKHRLLAAVNYLETMSKHVQRTQDTNQQLFATACARGFVEKHSTSIDAFVESFSATEMSDEKSVAIENFLSVLCSQLDDEAVWTAMSDDEWHSGQLTIERYCFGRIYRSAFWPNGETDKNRDRLIHEHIDSLSRTISVFHKSLQVAPKYCGQAPWPAAVDILRQMALYKAPVDKLNTVSDCAQCIMFLLSRASRLSTLQKHVGDGVDENQIEHSVPGADDMFPVLVYVIIQANPQALLSTVAYVENYHRTRMQGEASYWWAQFQSAVEYIKTLQI